MKTKTWCQLITAFNNSIFIIPFELFLEKAIVQALITKSNKKGAECVDTSLIINCTRQIIKILYHRLIRYKLLWM